MPVPFLSSITLNKNEVQDFKVFNYAGDVTPLTGTDIGYFWTNTTGGKTLRWWDGAAVRTILDSASTTIVAADLSGGAAGSLPYQVGSGDTTFLGIGTANQVLKVNSGATAPEWVNQSSLSVGSATTATTADKVANELTAGTYLTSGGTFDGSTARTFAVDATSDNTASKVVARDGSGNFSAGTITASLTGNASTATNVSGGAAGELLYQSGLATTVKLAAGTNGYILTYDGSGGNAKPQWSASIPAGSVSGLAASATTDTTNAANISSGLLPLARLALANGQFYVGDASNNPAATAKSSISLTGFGALTADLDIAGFNITNSGNVTSGSSGSTLATKGYVDSVAQGLDIKASCLVASTADINLSAPGSGLIDGIDPATFTSGTTRILVKDQSLSQQNGIYIWNGTGSAMTRSLDANTWDELVGAFTFIETGTANADSGWVCTANAGGTLGTTPVPFVKFSQAGSYTGGNGMVLSGGVFHFAQDTNYTAGRIPFASGNTTIGFNANLFWDNTNSRLGIGTATPGRALDVVGNSQVSGYAKAGQFSVAAGPLAAFDASSGGLYNYYSSGGVIAAYSDNSGTLGSLSLDASSIVFRPGGTTKATLDSSGNLGLSVTPKTWGNYFKVIQQGDYAAFGHNIQNASAFVTSNAYNDNNTDWKYLYGSVAASRYDASQGKHIWYNAAAGTANQVFTWTQVMTLDASGRLGIGTASPSTKLVVSDSGAQGLEFNPNASGLGMLEVYNRSTSQYYGFRINADDIRFHTGASAALRATLDSSGNLGLGVTPAFRFHVYSLVNNETRFQTASTTAGHTNRLSFSVPTGTADSRSGVIEWYDLNTFKGDMRFLKAGGIQIRNSADSPTVTLDDSGRLGIGCTPALPLHVEYNGQAELRLKNTSASGLAAIGMVAGNQTNPWYIATDSSRNFWFQDNATTRLYIAATGVIGVATTPSGWTGGAIINLANSGAISSKGTTTSIVSNGYFSDQWRHYGNGRYCQYYQNDGTHIFYGSANNTNGADQPFTPLTYVTIDASGNLGVGTSPGHRLDIRDNSTGLLARLSSTSTGGCSMQFVSTSTNGRTYRIGSNYVSGSGEFSIYDDTAGLERLRIKSTGQLNLTGLASAPTGAVGDLYYNSATDSLQLYSGAWNTLTRKISAAGVGTGATITVTHNWGTRDVLVQVRNNSHAQVLTDVTYGEDSVTVTFADSNTTLSNYTVTVIG
jgi:hypothetical protein